MSRQCAWCGGTKDLVAYSACSGELAKIVKNMEEREKRPRISRLQPRILFCSAHSTDCLDRWLAMRDETIAGTSDT